jgi:hypothetical protein
MANKKICDMNCGSCDHCLGLPEWCTSCDICNQDMLLIEPQCLIEYKNEGGFRRNES